MTDANGANGRTHPAFEYAKLGWHVVPVHNLVGGACSCGHACKSPGKHPRIDDWNNQASADPAKIQAWLTAWPDMNVGIATGPSGLYVLDVDPKNGGDKGLEELLKRVGDGVMDTVRVQTGGGGLHVYYRRTGDHHNTAGDLGSGLDTRGVGGFVVAPPSLHASGRRYEWAKGRAPGEVPLLELPTAIVQQLVAAKGGKRNGAAPLPQKVAAGGRNQHLASLAGTLQKRGLPREVILASLQSANATICEPPLPARELDSIVRSIERYPKGQVPDVMLSAGQNDTGNAQRLAALYGQMFRHVHEWGFIVWDGRRWRRDTSSQMYEFAKSTARSLREAAAGVEDDEKRKAMMRFAESSHNLARIRAAIELTQGDPNISRFVDDFDAHDGLLNVRNGTIDLATSELLPHNPDLYLTGLVDIDFDAAAQCPRWQQFVRDFCLGDTQLVEFLQRWVGYTLTGYTKEHALLFLFGDGRNGKSTFVNIVSRLLGDLATPLAFEALLASRETRSSQELAVLVGKRLGVAVEAPEGRSFNEELIKTVTGGEHRLNVKLLYKDSFSFTPKFKLMITGNDKPTIRGVNEGIWERLHLFPCQLHVERHKRDKDLERRLVEELPGILAWAVRGAVAWHKTGLQPPKKVHDAVEEYRQDNDVVGRWIEEACTIGEGNEATAGELQTAFNDRARRLGEKEISAKALSIRLAKFRAGLLKKSKNSKSLTVWSGIALGKDLPSPVQPGLQAFNGAPPSAAAPAAAYQHDRLVELLDLIRLEAGKAPKGWCTDVLLEQTLALRGRTAWEVQKDLETLRRNNAVYCPGGSGTYRPMNPGGT